MTAKYTPEVKASVMAALMSGQGVPEIAKEYEMPASTIRSWKSRQFQGASVAYVATEKKEQVGDLLIEYLRANLETLRIQVQFFRTLEWLEKQPAADLAVLHGVMTDKAVRLLEALSKADDA